MEKILFSSKLYSHPDKLLVDHLTDVANSCVVKFKDIKHNLTSYFSDEIWEKLVWVMGFSHDIGKATSFFQAYLIESNEDKRKILKNKPETTHSLLSAVMAYWILSHFEYKEDNELLLLMPLFIFLIIKKHHGNILNAIPGNDFSNELDVPIDHLDNQIEHIDKLELQNIFEKINRKFGLNIKTENLPSSFNLYFKIELRRKAKKFFKKFKKKTEYYLIFQFLYSLLLHSDKYDAIFAESHFIEHPKFDPFLVEKYKDLKFGKPKSKIDIIRENIFNDANDSIINVDLSQKIFSINVPTGTGKTLTCLSVALKLRDRLQKDGINSRIIYGLPFTSIIDQNFQVFSEVFDNPSSDILLKHHHLSEIVYNTSNIEAEFEADQAKFMIESWESEIVVTTFFQIFHTLFSNRNRMIQKFHKLANSIILLDEVQSLPYKYWKLVEEVIPILTDMFNIYFILITATQPEIFEPNQITELVPQKEKYFEQFDRVNLQFNTEKVTLNEYKEKCENALRSTDESYLFIMNTIGTSLDLFTYLQNCKFDADYFYLTTNIIPIHRQIRIENIKKSPKRKIIVSTQLVEAGVDIDIENVWRDFAPLESINQVCGRCNRNFSSKRGSVKIFEIINENHYNKPYSSYIYGKSPLGLIETKDSLRASSTITEREFLHNIDNYYKIIKNRISNDESLHILQLLNELRFQEIYKSFKLIENDNYMRKDIFIEIDDFAKETWHNFLYLQKIKDRFKRKTEFLKIRKDFYDYVISVPAKYVPEEKFEDTEIVHISHEQIYSCYNQETGWIRTDENYIF
jgi:CRISPR-associated endonuclease/helicase Cas3